MRVPTCTGGGGMSPPALLGVGEVVDLHITARVGHGHDGFATFIVGESEYIRLRDGDPAVAIRRRTPADGVPEPGDLWRDIRGNRYFATGGDVVCFVAQVPTAGRFLHPWEEIHAGPNGPITLEYRPTAAIGDREEEVEEATDDDPR